MRVKFFIIIFLLFTLQACSNFNDKSIELQNNDINLSLIKHLFLKKKVVVSKYHLNLKPYYFLKIQGNDPSKHILSELKKSGFKVYGSSISKIQQGKLVVKILDNKQNTVNQIVIYEALRHKRLGGLGTAYYLRKIKWINATKVIIIWSTYLSGLNASVSEATLELKNKKWVVTNIKRLATS